MLGVSFFSFYFSSLLPFAILLSTILKNSVLLCFCFMRSQIALTWIIEMCLTVRYCMCLDRIQVKIINEIRNYNATIGLFLFSFLFWELQTKTLLALYWNEILRVYQWLVCGCQEENNVKINLLCIEIRIYDTRRKRNFAILQQKNIFCLDFWYLLSFHIWSIKNGISVRGTHIISGH